jgi:2-C-methyl-D-erythritol 2,4-cyclodiphosphate synthase
VAGLPQLRVGCGYDVHAFSRGRPFILGGVTIEHERGLAGHSDGDVLTHAVVDALLGATGRGDIGDWFPPGDARYRDATSLTFLDQVMNELGESGWRLVNVDTTLIAQEPRLASYRVAIRDCLAERLGLEASHVSVKATTADHLGALGRAEGVAAQAVVLLKLASDTADDSPRQRSGS